MKEKSHTSSDLKDRINQSETEIANCCNCETLAKEKGKLSKALEKFTKGSNMLKVILQEQKGYMDKTDIGYKTGFVLEKKKNDSKPKIHHFQKSYYSTPYSFCNYCNKKGHTQSSCYHRKYGISSSYKWLPKGTWATKVPADRGPETNTKGPKEYWVPKSV